MAALQNTSQGALQVLFNQVHSSQEQRDKERSPLYVKTIKKITTYPFFRLSPSQKPMRLKIDLSMKKLTPNDEDLSPALLELKTRHLLVGSAHQQEHIDNIARSSLQYTPEGTIKAVMQFASSKAPPSPKAPSQPAKPHRQRSSHDQHISGRSNRSTTR